MKPDQFPSPKPSFTKEEMETYIKIKLVCGLSQDEFLAAVRFGAWFRFVLTNDFKLGIAQNLHARIQYELGASNNFLVEDGSFGIDVDTKKIRFLYHSPIRTVAHSAAEEKIRNFLKDSGLDLK